jgi:hypothetical protein
MGRPVDLLRPLLATLLSLAPVAALWNEGASLGSVALVGWVTLVQVAFACVPARAGSSVVSLAVALPSFAVAAALDVAAGAAPVAVGARCAVALVALVLLLVSGAQVRAGRGTLVHSVVVFGLVLLAPAFEIALEVAGVQGARTEWFEACGAAGPLGFAWATLELGAEVSWTRAVAALAAPVLVFALVQLAREKEPQP